MKTIMHVFSVLLLCSSVIAGNERKGRASAKFGKGRFSQIIVHHQAAQEHKEKKSQRIEQRKIESNFSKNALAIMHKLEITEEQVWQTIRGQNFVYQMLNQSIRVFYNEDLKLAVYLPESADKVLTIRIADSRQQAVETAYVLSLN